MAIGEGKTYTIPIGPVHVGLKEPITAWLQVDGERIVDVRIRPGAIHRGIEYMARDRNPIQVIYLKGYVVSVHLLTLFLCEGCRRCSQHSRSSEGKVYTHYFAGA